MKNGRPSKVRNKGEDVKRELANSSGLPMFQEAVGTGDDYTDRLLVAEVLRAIPGFETNLDQCLKSVLVHLRGIGPQDELERLIAVQMVAEHHLAMSFFAEGSRAETTMEAKDRYTNLAIKVLRTFTAQLDALNRHRGKVSQQMVVGSVNVTDGGQAIVGPVNGGPGKVSQENDERTVG